MKENIKLFLPGLIALLLFCKQNPAYHSDFSEAPDFVVLGQDFDWMLGNWTRTNEEENKKTFESWEKQSELMYKGFAYTLQNTDTVWQENVELIKSNEGWSYNVTAKGETEPTRFALTAIEEERFVCQNPANEFPTTIEYSRSGDILLAKISGNDMEMLFEFVKMDE